MADSVRAPAVWEWILLIWGRMTRVDVKFCRSCTFWRPQQLQVRLPFAYGSRLIGVGVDCRKIAVAGVVPWHVVSRWTDLLWSGPGAREKLPKQNGVGPAEWHTWHYGHALSGVRIAPVGLMVCGVILEVRHDCLVETFDFSITLGVVCSCWNMIDV